MKRGSSTHVVVVDVDTGAVTQLTDAQGQSWPNSWSPDGEWIAFAGERDSVWNVWAVSTRTRETRQLTRFADRAGYVRWPAWSPTGERIVFEHNRARGTIWTTTLR
jgi:Tol biopolymer transport system component